MEIYLQKNSQQDGPYSEEQLRNFVSTGKINQFDLARHEGSNDWQPLCTIIHIALSSAPPASPATSASSLPPVPTTNAGPSASQSPSPPPASSPSAPLPTFTTPELNAPLPPPDLLQDPAHSQPVSTSGIFQEMRWKFIDQLAIIGGWACFAAGFTVLIAFSWPFYIHYALFVAAVLFSIEALSQHKIVAGMSLLLVTLILPTLIGFGLLLYQINQDSESTSSAFRQTHDEITRKG